MRSGICKLGVALVVTVALCAPSYAAEGTDPDDVAGKLDLKRVEARREGGVLELRATTWDDWGKRTLTSGNKIVVLFNVDDDRAVEYKGVITKTGRQLSMSISGSGQAFESLPVSKPDQDTIKARVPGGSPPNPDHAIRLRFKTRYTGDGCAMTCTDRAPDEGWLHVGHR